MKKNRKGLLITGKDWKSNSMSAFATIGARVNAKEGRETTDFYATDPNAMEQLLNLENFSQNIWEPACGEGHLSKVLTERGFNVRSTDLYDRGYGESGIDFLMCTNEFDGDIITNPPYRYAEEFVNHSLELVPKGHKVAMLLKLTFLEGKGRASLFKDAPPIRIYVSISRLRCAKNGDFEQYARQSAVAYAWFVWSKGFAGDPSIKWFN